MLGCIGETTHLGEELFHNLGPVVDGENDVFDTSGDEGLDLVDNHGLVAELDEGFGKREGLSSRGG